MVAQTAQKAPRDEGDPGFRPIPRARAQQAAFVVGEMLNITLEGEETIEEGVQDVRRWADVSRFLSMNQWLQIGNDAGSFWRVMRVERLHGSPSSGLRALILRDVVPPKVIDVAKEPITATGEWYVRYGGAHRQWMVINPAGVVRRDGIHSHAEASNVCHVERGNPPPV